MLSSKVKNEENNSTETTNRNRKKLRNQTKNKIVFT